jgi:hypothetical protein
VIRIVSEITLLVVVLGVYIWYLWSLARLFPQIGLKYRQGWIPFYNEWLLLERAGFSGFWVLTALIPGAGLLILWAVRTFAINRLNAELGFSEGYTVTGCVLPPLWATLVSSALDFRVEPVAQVQETQPVDEYSQQFLADLAAGRLEQQQNTGEYDFGDQFQSQPGGAHTPAPSNTDSAGFSWQREAAKQREQSTSRRESQQGETQQSKAQQGETQQPETQHGETQHSKAQSRERAQQSEERYFAPSDVQPSKRDAGSSAAAGAQAPGDASSTTQSSNSDQPNREEQHAMPDESHSSDHSQTPREPKRARRAAKRAKSEPVQSPTQQHDAPEPRAPVEPQAPADPQAPVEPQGPAVPPYAPIPQQPRPVYYVPPEGFLPQQQNAGSNGNGAGNTSPEPPAPRYAPPVNHNSDGQRAASSDSATSSTDEAESASEEDLMFLPQAPAHAAHDSKRGDDRAHGAAGSAGQDSAEDHTILVPKKDGWVIELPDGETLPVEGEDVVIGRKPTEANAITIPDPTRTLSKSHARLVWRDRWYIEDLGSTNGLTIIEESGKETEMTPGSLVPAPERFVLGTLEVKLRHG